MVELADSKGSSLRLGLYWLFCFGVFAVSLVLFLKNVADKKKLSTYELNKKNTLMELRKAQFLVSSGQRDERTYR
ncbi:MAG: hypothetical protein NZT61_07835 [Deltaproteobacteria bacterium]|nr:hypothetical protein [Deltaproteobacteria bacterium]MCX7952798.1 hypothetical protein [Deltaproteobacteria bacterium]